LPVASGAPLTCPFVSFLSRIIRALAYDPCVAAVAARLDIDEKTVRLLRHRFMKYGLKGLCDKARSGRPRRISDVTRCEIVALACERPAAHGVAFRRTWTFVALRSG
jgi:transposase